MYKQSLNADLSAGVDDDYDTDLDVVPQIVETVGTGAPPEFEEESQTLSAMETRIEDLLVLRAEIQHQRGMSQALAIEGLRIMPEFGDGAPVSFYGVQPGRTRLAIANESIVSGVWSAIRSALAALRRMIGKFVGWVTGKSADGGDEVSLDEAASATQKDLAALTKVAQELLEAMKAYRGSAYRTREEGAPAHLSFEQVFGYVQSSSKNYFYGDQPGPKKLYLDLLHDGEYSKLMKALGNLCEGLTVIMKQRVNLLDSIVEKDFKRPDPDLESITVLHDLQKLDAPLTVRFEGHELTLDELNALMRDRRQGGDAKGGDKRHEKFEVEDLYLAFSRIEQRLDISESIRALRKLMPLMTDMESHIGELETRLGEVLFQADPGHAAATIASELMTVISRMSRDVNDLGVLARSVLSYAAEIRMTARMAIRLAIDVARFVVENIVDEISEAPPEWVALLAKLERIRP